MILFDIGKKIVCLKLRDEINRQLIRVFIWDFEKSIGAQTVSIGWR